MNLKACGNGRSLLTVLSRDLYAGTNGNVKIFVNVCGVQFKIWKGIPQKFGAGLLNIYLNVNKINRLEIFLTHSINHPRLSSQSPQFNIK